MRIDRTGCTRIVMLTKRHAFKLPNFLNGWKLFLRGLLANMDEVSISKWFDTGIVVSPNSREFCPVIFSLPLGLLAVMPKVRVLTDEEFSQVEYPKNPHYCNNLDIFVNDAVYTVENKANSFGWLNGKIVCIDYGN